MAEFARGYDARRGHGLPGRSGRPSASFKAWCASLFEEQTLNPSSWPEGRRKLWERAQKSDRIALDLLARAYGPSGVPWGDGEQLKIIVEYEKNWRAVEGQKGWVPRALENLRTPAELPDGTKDEERSGAHADRAPGEGADPASPGRPRYITR